MGLVTGGKPNILLTPLLEGRVPEGILPSFFYLFR